VWYRHWVEHGLAALEARLVAEDRSGRFALGDAVTMADVFVVPQISSTRSEWTASLMMCQRSCASLRIAWHYLPLSMRNH